MSRHYKDALRLMTLEIDWRDVAIDYAQRHPADFCRAVKTQHEEDWEREAKEGASLVHAIKICRAATGWSLKDAKWWADRNWVRQEK